MSPHADQQIPADLIDLKRRFIDAEAEQARLAATLPASMALATGQASLTDEQHSAWRQIQAEVAEPANAELIARTDEPSRRHQKICRSRGRYLRHCGVVFLS